MAIDKFNGLGVLTTLEIVLFYLQTKGFRINNTENLIIHR